MATSEQDSNIKQEFNTASVGLNQDQSANQVKKGALTYALNATIENFDANSVSYQNEGGNEFCLNFPADFVLIGKHFIPERNKHIFMLVNPETEESQIGYMDNTDCVYRTYATGGCLNFNVNYPIHKIVHKITNCSTEIYWADRNGRRYMDLDNIPYLLQSGSTLCDPKYGKELDCNQLKLQSNFSIPTLEIKDVVSGGNLIAGTVQFGIQYSDANGNPYTSYYSITNPTSISDPTITSMNFNYPVGKSVIVNISNLDSTGHFQYFNLVVIKTINAISTPELVGTYYIDNTQKQVIYTGQNVEAIKLSMEEVFEKFPTYDIAEDVTTVQDVIIWSGLTSIDRINYQSIANKIKLYWETWRIPSTENYATELNTTNFRSYLRDEVYPFEVVFLLANGKQTDRFHIPGRALTPDEINKPEISTLNADFVGTPTYYVDDIGFSPYWKIYNTSSVLGTSEQFSSDPKYKGSYQYGEFAYWESTEEYPCDKVLWGELAGKKIRHHKFPDVSVSPIFESKTFTNVNSMVMGNDAIFPIGVKIDVQYLKSLINSSDLTDSQKSDIVGFKIVRGDRSTNKSVIAKGILRNVGIYEREDQKFYYPNYPYNDLNQDPFLTSTNNAFSQTCNTYNININHLERDSSGGADFADIQYTDCNTNKQAVKRFYSTDTFELCSISKPIFLNSSAGVVSIATYEEWRIQIKFGIGTVGWVDPVDGYKEIPFGPGYSYLNVVVGTGAPKGISGAEISTLYLGLHAPSSICNKYSELPAIKDNETLKYRQVFNSPETSFGQPFLGDTLKLESVIFGTGKAHFVEVKNNAKYKLITEQAQRKALDSSNKLGAITSDFNASAMFAAYQAYLTIYINGITRKNFAYSFNSIADYNYMTTIPNELGIKQRKLDIKRYLIPGVQSVNDEFTINNYERESSIYLRTDLDKTPLPHPDKTPNMLFGDISLVSDKSRFTVSGIGNCNKPGKEEPIQVVSYYASLKNDILNQWGQIYSYEAIDTGFQRIFNNPTDQPDVIFGGDTFINRFAFKTKLPFFIDNRVGAPDDSDIFYDEIGNIAYPKYWHSARSILKDYMSSGGLLSNIISYKAHNFDCPNDVVNTVIEAIPIGSETSITTTTTTTTLKPDVPVDSELTYYDGYFYLFAYGTPNFYCESSYNLDLRQAFNNKEGDFYPHVSTGIPDEWVQESFVSIAMDNTYYYNTTYSKQNKENTFTSLPPDWEEKLCYTHFPFRSIYSNKQDTNATTHVNNWLVYSPLSYFDFPQTNGKLISLDGIQNKAILARFENKSLLYNNLLTVNTSNPQAAYFGNPDMFKGAPPIDFAETDLGYVGSQHKMLLKIPQGQVTIDAKRGQIFLIEGTQISELSTFGSGMNRFFTDHLAFEILRYYPDVDIDNAYNSIGLHGVYDSKFDRLIITKLDYIPLNKEIKYDSSTFKFYINKKIGNETIKETVLLTDTDYFCNKSWTLSYNMNTRSWISFHSYIPNFYIAENNFFYSGIKGCCDEFDAVAVVSVPEPSTSTTTSTTTIVCSLNAEVIPITTTTTSSTSTTTTTSTTAYITTTTTTTAHLCWTCPEGYVPIINGCYTEESITPNPPSAAEILANKTYGGYGKSGGKFYRLEGADYIEDDTIPILTTDVVWKNTSENLTDGVLNRCGVWSALDATPGQYIGFGREVVAPVGKIYYVGLGADNYMSLEINNILVKQFPSGDTINDHYESWHLFPVYLNAGSNLIHMIGYNDLALACMGAEIYDATLSQLQNVTSVAELDALTIFSTKSLIGSYVEEGNFGTGFTCPDGYTLVNRDGVLTCDRTIYTDCDGNTI